MQTKKTAKKNVLVLGAGLVARPLVHYLMNLPDFHVRIASRTVSKAQALSGGHPQVEAVPYDIEKDDGYRQLAKHVADADLAVSLLPATLHYKVAELCVAKRRHMVTTSYVSPEMNSLDGKARKAGVLLLNEIGVDPGIDHMSAMKIIHDVHSRKGRVVSFRSYCGGLPAPEDNDNPFGYKFSWTPLGVVRAARNGAMFREDGRIVMAEPKDLFATVHQLKLPGLATLDCYPNRNSLIYEPLYGLTDAHTIFRGTLRYPGWCQFWFQINRLGLFDMAVRPTAGLTYAEYLRTFLPEGYPANLQEAVAKFLGLKKNSLVLEQLDFLGFFSKEKVPCAKTTPLELLAGILARKLVYAEGERDMIVLHHDFRAEFPKGRRERITSTLIDYAIPGGDSSMSRTVSLPAAIAVRMILEGKIPLTGVQIPIHREIYEPVLSELEGMGIKCHERRSAAPSPEK